MYKILFSVAFLALFTVLSCGDQGAEDTGVHFDITFQATYDGAQLEKDKEYQLGNIPLFFESSRLYLSDITLLKGNQTFLISEIEYLDFTPTSASFATPKITFNNVPEGDYTGIRLGYGVKPVLNARTPSNFPAGHPLSVEIDYWAGWSSYIFSVLDGKADSNNDGTKNLSFSYHCGSDAVYKTVDFAYPISVQDGQPGATIAFDMKAFLTNDDGTFYDLLANPATSNSPNNVVVAQALSNHWPRATTISQ